MTQSEYQEKCVEIADKLGCQILFEESDVYLQADDVKSHLLRLPVNSAKWRRIYHELTRWGDGCNLIAPVEIS